MRIFISGGFKNGKSSHAQRLADKLVAAVNSLRRIVIVSDYIYSDALMYGETVEAYKRNLAYIDRRLAAICDVVLEGCCGQIIVHKGEDKFRKLGGLSDV